MQLIGPNDALLVSQGAMYSFALDAGTSVRVQAAPDRLQGFLPRFRDHRIHAVTLSKAGLADVDRTVKTADRVLVIDSNLDIPGFLPDRTTLAKELGRLGFQRASVAVVNYATIVIWRRA
jgi:hypothetical protein